VRLQLKTGTGQAPRTPIGVRILENRLPGVARYRSLTPGYIPYTPPACERSPEGCWEISPGLSEAIPGVCLSVCRTPAGCEDNLDSCVAQNPPNLGFTVLLKMDPKL
jgi:hypothetical protein